MASPTYNVYRVQHRLGIQDHLMGPDIRYHNVIFIETDANGGGWIAQVTGSIVDDKGMTFEKRREPRPESVETFVQKQHLGEIRASDYASLMLLLQTLPPPPRQRIFNTTTLSYDKCKPNGTLYSSEEAPPPYKKCTEWTMLDAIPAMQRSGILRSA